MPRNYGFLLGEKRDIRFKSSKINKIFLLQGMFHQNKNIVVLFILKYNQLFQVYLLGLGDYLRDGWLKECKCFYRLYVVK